MKKVGNCPYCSGEVNQRKTEIMGKKVSIYSCSNAKYEKEEYEEGFSLTEDSTCNFTIFSNCLLKYNKRTLSEKEVRKILRGEDCIVRLYSKKIYNSEKGKYGGEYFKYVTADKEYGVSVIFDVDVEEEDL